MDAATEALAHSLDLESRAEAGRRLAACAGEPDADALLLGLLLDGQDTWVSAETAEALLTRGDAAALRVLLRGLGAADENTFNKVSDQLWQYDWAPLTATAEQLAEAEPALSSGRDRLLAFFEAHH